MLPEHLSKVCLVPIPSSSTVLDTSVTNTNSNHISVYHLQVSLAYTHVQAKIDIRCTSNLLARYSHDSPLWIHQRVSSLGGWLLQESVTNGKNSTNIQQNIRLFLSMFGKVRRFFWLKIESKHLVTLSLYYRRGTIKLCRFFYITCILQIFLWMHWLKLFLKNENAHYLYVFKIYTWQQSLYIQNYMHQSL